RKWKAAVPKANQAAMTRPPPAQRRRNIRSRIQKKRRMRGCLTAHPPLITIGGAARESIHGTSRTGKVGDELPDRARLHALRAALPFRPRRALSALRSR